MTTQAFNFIGPQPTAQPTQGPLAQMALALGGTAAVPAVQGNEVLANALDQLQKSGAETSKTPLALGANLLADLLLTTSRNRNNAALLKQVQSGQAAMQAAASQGTGLDASGNLIPAAAPGAAAAPPSAPPAPSGAPPGGSPLADALAPPPAAPAATDHPLAAALAPLTADQVAALRSNPQAFLGIPGATITSGARSPQHNAAVGGVPTSEHIPGNGYAYDFVPPKGMTNDQAVAQIAASGIPYDQLIGEGNHIHIGWRPEGVQGRGQVLGVPLTGAAPGAGGAPQAAPTSAEPPQPPPSQWPSSPAPQSASGPPPAGAQPQGQSGFSMQPVPIAPQQFARLEALKVQAQKYPPGSAMFQNYAQQYLAYRDELSKQASTPEEPEISRPNDVGQITISGKTSGRVYGTVQAPGFISAAGPKMVMGPSGPMLVAGTGTRQLPPSAPGVETQQDMTGKITNEAIPNAMAAGGTMRWNGQSGRYEPIPELQPSQAGGFAPGTVVSREPGKSPTVVQAPPYTPQDVISQRNAFKSGDTYRSYVNTAAALNSLGTILQQATGNNGIVDMSAFDNLIRAQTGLSARQGNMAMMMQHLGFPAEAAGLVSNIAGNGFVTPDQVKSAYQALRGYATTHQSIAQHELDEEAAAAKAGGQNFGLTLPTLSAPPNVPWMGSSNPGGGSQSAASVIAAARAAIARGAPRAAVIQRTRSLGVDPSGL